MTIQRMHVDDIFSMFQRHLLKEWAAWADVLRLVSPVGVPVATDLEYRKLDIDPGRSLRSGDRSERVTIYTRLDVCDDLRVEPMASPASGSTARNMFNLRW